jgi:hypothetical protein
VTGIEPIFTLTFLVTVPFWVLMIVLPGRRWTGRIIGSPWIAVPPLLAYLAVMIPILPRYWPVISNPDLGALQQVLATQAGAATVWAHLVAFDLLVARWMYLDARVRGVHPLIMAPILVATIFLAPVGFLAYLLVRGPARRPDHAAVPAPAGTSGVSGAGVLA